MDVPSTLEQFLQSQLSEGEAFGEGEFTIARDKALQKLAQFRLPFDGAWAVKTLQALVAGGVQTQVTVHQTRRVTEFECDCPLPWTLDELEETYFNPEPSKNRALQHLISALWTVGVNEKRGFQLSLPHQEESLVWNGSNLQRVNCPLTVGFSLTVTHQSPSSQSAWGFNQVSVSQRNSEVLLALRDHCFTSPVPLLVDGRRIDGLHNCTGHGWSSQTFPLCLAFVEGNLPNLKWPPGTFETIDKSGNNDLNDGCGLEGFTKKILKAVPRLESSAMAMFVTAHLNKQGTQGGLWEMGRGNSLCYWVQDGVLVQGESFGVPSGGCSVACYISAQDLKNDLSGFYLSDSAERTRRKNEAAKLAVGPLKSLYDVSEKAVRSHNRSRYEKLGNSVLVLALGVGWYVPVIGIPIGGLMGIFGLFARFAERQEEKKLVQSVMYSIRTLQSQWSGKTKTSKKSKPR